MKDCNGRKFMTIWYSDIIICYAHFEKYCTSLLKMAASCGSRLLSNVGKEIECFSLEASKPCCCCYENILL